MRASEIELQPPPFEDAADIFGMANLYPRTTGLPVTVWVSPQGHARHDARINVSARPGDRMDLDDTVVVSVRPRAALLHGKLPPEHLGPVLKWVELNMPALVDYWNGAIDTVELSTRLKKL